MRITKKDVSNTPLPILLELLPFEAKIIKSYGGFVYTDTRAGYMTEISQNDNESFHDFIGRIVFEGNLINRLPS